MPVWEDFRRHRDPCPHAYSLVADTAVERLTEAIIQACQQGDDAEARVVFLLGTGGTWFTSARIAGDCWSSGTAFREYRFATSPIGRRGERKRDWSNFGGIKRSGVFVLPRLPAEPKMDPISRAYQKFSYA